MKTILATIGIPCVLLVCFSFISKNALQEKVKITYKLGDIQNTFEARSIYASVKTETVEGKSNSSLTFTLNDYDKKIAFRFVIKDEKVVSDFTGSYPLRFPGGYQDGESIQATNIMIIDTGNATNTFQTRPGGKCEIRLKGTILSVNITGAKISKGGVDVPFEFSFTSPNTKVKRE